MDRGDLSGAEWELIGRLLPPERGRWVEQGIWGALLQTLVDLPFAGVATPITYAVGGRQVIVIATCGSRDPNGPQGSAFVAFPLPLTSPHPINRK